MEEKIINMNQFLGAAQGDQEHMLGKFLYFSLANLLVDGWKVTDCKICFEYGLYYSPVSTPADFRLLSPIVLEQALKKAGTELLEPYLHFEIYAPQEYLSRAYHDAPRYCADIVSTQIKNDEVILKGEIPARCIQEWQKTKQRFMLQRYLTGNWTQPMCSSA